MYVLQIFQTTVYIAHLLEMFTQYQEILQQYITVGIQEQWIFPSDFQGFWDLRFRCF